MKICYPSYNLYQFLVTCEGECCWQGPNRDLVKTGDPADGINGWPEKHDTVEDCAKRCEELYDCQAFHFNGSDSCFLYKEGVIGPEHDDDRISFAAVCLRKGNNSENYN